MSGRFERGDTVGVVDARPSAWHEPKDMDLSLDDVFTVLRYVPSVFKGGSGFPRSFVVLAGLEGRVCQWDAYRFRKLDAPQSEVADRIRACKPQREQVPA